MQSVTKSWPAPKFPKIVSNAANCPMPELYRHANYFAIVVLKDFPKSGFPAFFFQAFLIALTCGLVSKMQFPNRLV
jgi:hypothetical protein